MPELLDFAVQNGMYEATCAGCYFGMTDEDGQPMKKEWRLITNSPRLARSLNACGCKHGPDVKHSQVQGKYTAKTAFYPMPMCETIINSLYTSKVWSHVPSMSCVPCGASCAHRQQENGNRDFADMHHGTPIGIAFDSSDELDHFLQPRELSLAERLEVSAALKARDIPAAVTRLLDRKEWRHNPKAYEAIKKEADGLIKSGTWDHNSVSEKDDVASEAKESCETVHFGNIS